MNGNKTKIYYLHVDFEELTSYDDDKIITKSGVVYYGYFAEAIEDYEDESIKTADFISEFQPINSKSSHYIDKYTFFSHAINTNSNQKIEISYYEQANCIIQTIKNCIKPTKTMLIEADVIFSGAENLFDISNIHAL